MYFSKPLWALSLLFLVESTAYKLPPNTGKEIELLDRSSGVNDLALSQYGFSIIRNTSIPCDEKTTSTEDNGEKVFHTVHITFSDKMRLRYHSLSDTDKLAILSTEGGSFVKEYMALGMEEAEKTFINLLGASLLSKKQLDGSAKEPRVWRVPRTKLEVLRILHAEREIKFHEKQTTGLPQYTESQSTHAIQDDKQRKEDKKNTKEPTTQTDHETFERSVPFLLPAEMGIQPSHTDKDTGDKSSYSYCQNRGQKTPNGFYLHMCTTCASTTSLGEGFWPPIINEAVRLDDDPYCFIADNIPQGECMQRIMPMNMLKRREGYCTLALKDGEIVIVDNWAPYTRELKIGCECVMGASSSFAQYVGKYNGPER